jgi:hypothetical protein
LDYYAVTIHLLRRLCLAAVGPVQPAYNLYFSACFFSRNSIFLSQKISQNSISAYFSVELDASTIFTHLKLLFDIFLSITHNKTD